METHFSPLKMSVCPFYLAQTAIFWRRPLFVLQCVLFLPNFVLTVLDFLVGQWMTESLTFLRTPCCGLVTRFWSTESGKTLGAVHSLPADWQDDVMAGATQWRGEQSYVQTEAGFHEPPCCPWTDPIHKRKRTCLLFSRVWLFCDLQPAWSQLIQTPAHLQTGLLCTVLLTRKSGTARFYLAQYLPCLWLSYTVGPPNKL